MVSIAIPVAEYQDGIFIFNQARRHSHEMIMSKAMGYMKTVRLKWLALKVIY